MHKFNEYSIGRLKLTYKYQYFSYIAQTFFLFFSWTDYPMSSMSLGNWWLSTDSDREWVSKNLTRYISKNNFIELSK